MSLVRGVAEALLRLDRIDLRQARRAALERAAVRLEDTVKLSLSHEPGEDHAAPWLRTGELRASITRQLTEDTAVIGSAEPVAVYQELGTRTLPPRPFLAPAGAAEAAGIARDFGEIIAAAIEGSR